MKPWRSQRRWVEWLVASLSVSVAAVAQTERADPMQNPYADTYEGIHEFSNAAQWGPYNVHDPALLSDGEFVYAYSTDVAWGQSIERAGIQIRRSRDLVNWEFRGWALDGRPPQAMAYLEEHGGEAFENVWAPCAVKVGEEYRLYYSQSSRVPKNSAIGLLTGPTPEGPWTERGLVVTTLKDQPGTNAIDPSVIVTVEGEHWMFYGSAWDGIYALRLDPQTGLALEPGNRGRRVAQRGNDGTKINGNIEAPDILYHLGLKKYYLFIAYDWLFTKYNVRVVRSDHPDGPYVDFHGRPANEDADDVPMILAPYRFGDHAGWQGVSHCGVVKHGEDYFLASQGRPVVSPHFMVMHARKMFWSPDGWPVVSPQRHGPTDDRPLERDALVGTWEVIDFGYDVVPGFADEQVDPGVQASQIVRLEADGGVEAPWASRWNLHDGRIEFTDEQGLVTIAVLDRAWDWERQRSTWVFTALKADGLPLWGKWIEPASR